MKKASFASAVSVGLLAVGLSAAWTLTGATPAAAQFLPLGASCTGDEQCRCAGGRCVEGRCAPRDGTGTAGQYCHHGNHCLRGMCGCADGTVATGFCPDWEIVGGGSCLGGGSADGAPCGAGTECASGACAEGRCAPRDGTGTAGQYCHHGNHCRTGLCGCADGAVATGFCPDWESRGGGRCAGGLDNGMPCRDRTQCASGYCADGRYCAPRDGTGAPGGYCHHGNHCCSGRCWCRRGSSFVVADECPGWQNLPPASDAEVIGVCL